MEPQERGSLGSSAWRVSGLALDQSEPKGRERRGSLNGGLKAVKLTNSSQIHLQRSGPCQGMAKSPAVGRPSTALVPGTPTPQRHHPHILSLL